MNSLKHMFSLLLFVFLVSNFFTNLRTLADLLPEDEVEALKTIAGKLHIKSWIIDGNFCRSPLNVMTNDKIFTNITCGSIENVSHVITIRLKGQNYNGTLPAEFANLRFLRELDLSRNYINGTIPPAFSKLNLTKLAIGGNRITGSIPKEIGDIATLEELVLETNKIGGPIPENLGNLTNLRILLLSGNNFSGKIPESFSNLKNLTEFSIIGNGLVGKIPDLIGNWTKITIIDMQGTSMEGPIPGSISQLNNMITLMISDLGGSSMEFPNLREMKQLKTLVLRNCKITGSIPPYIGGFTNLTTLDLSFNMLTGQIPNSLQGLKLDYMFLNSNSLSGAVPGWVVSNSDDINIDISYNNFTDSRSFGCQESQRVNVVSSCLSSTGSNTAEWCLKKDLRCSTPPKNYQLFINCGGEKLPFEGHKYEDDLTIGGPSHFYPSSQKWAYSSTGVFMNNDKVAKDARYIADNTLSLSLTNPEIYSTARFAPTSLKYYGLCLQSGSYKVRLYFAEIMYSNDQTFNSLGNRIFDISIQGTVVQKDFNLMEEAKVAGNGTIKEFDTLVNGSTLEIHLYWSGKGINSMSYNRVYGPLISAISVTPNFHPNTGFSVGAIVGIVAASCVLLVIVLVALWKKGYLSGKDSENKELRALDLQTGYFTLRQIKAATNNFDHANKIGEGGFGPVYKGVLSDGAVIAVKQLSSKSKQGNREFVNEVGMISALQHPNLVKLYGCCIEGNQLLLIYEYMENNSLARALFGPEEQRLKLDWPTRKRICLGIARGLAYLHEESRLKIVHRDIKATNVLLDKDLNAKISDFGLAKLDDEENTHISTRIAGTIGYMAPEYAMSGYLTDKSDVYSFGIVALEIVSGKSNTNYRHKEELVFLLDWAYVLQEQGNLVELVDPELGSNYSVKEVMNMLNVGLLCTNPSSTLRPSMSSVASMLDGKTPIPPTRIAPTSANKGSLWFKPFEKLSQDSGTHASSSSTYSNVQRSSGLSMEGLLMDSTISSQNESEVRDLYDVNLDYSNVQRSSGLSMEGLLMDSTISSHNESKVRDLYDVNLD